MLILFPCRTIAGSAFAQKAGICWNREPGLSNAVARKDTHAPYATARIAQNEGDCLCLVGIRAYRRTATGSMPIGNDTHWGVLLQNGEVFNLVELYNPATDTWSATAQDPIYAHAPVVLLPHGNVYAGGTIQGDSVYRPTLNQWTNFPPPPCTTSKQNCEGGGALLNTGKVLVAGGITEVPGSPYPTAETNGNSRTP